MWASDLLQMVKVNPYQHLGQKTLSALSAYLLGFDAGLTDAGHSDPTRLNDLTFTDWVIDKFRLPRTTFCWDRLLLFVAEDESRSFDLFYTLLDEYLPAHPCNSSTSSHSVFRELQSQPDMRRLLRELQENWQVFTFPSVTKLYHYIQGYTFALQSSHVTPENTIDLSSFASWLSAKYCLQQSYPWYKVLLLNWPNEADAYFGFYELLQQFLGKWP